MRQGRRFRWRLALRDLRRFHVAHIGSGPVRENKADFATNCWPWPGPPLRRSSWRLRPMRLLVQPLSFPECSRKHARLAGTARILSLTPVRWDKLYTTGCCESPRERCLDYRCGADRNGKSDRSTAASRSAIRTATPGSPTPDNGRWPGQRDWSYGHGSSGASLDADGGLCGHPRATSKGMGCIIRGNPRHTAPGQSDMREVFEACGYLRPHPACGPCAEDRRKDLRRYGGDAAVHRANERETDRDDGCPENTCQRDRDRGEAELDLWPLQRSVPVAPVRPLENSDERIPDRIFGARRSMRSPDLIYTTQHRARRLGDATSSSTGGFWTRMPPRCPAGFLEDRQANAGGSSTAQEGDFRADRPELRRGAGDGDADGREQGTNVLPHRQARAAISLGATG